MSLSADDVLREAGDWVWVPEAAEQVQTDDFRVIAYPLHFAHPTVVASVHSPRPAETVLAEALLGVEELGRGDVCFQGLSDSTRPPDLEALLVERGADRYETLSVLALDLGEGLPDLDVPRDVELEQVLDLEAMREVDRLETSIFGGSAAGEEQLAAALRPVLEGQEPPRVLARRDGVPVGSAGHVMHGHVLRLWGAGVVPEARGTGVYRALLDHRLRAGLAAGARMALVKGRVETSAPVLLRAGFQRYGEERSYRLARG